MGKIIATIFLAVFIWYSVPLLLRGLWVSPTLYPDYWYGEDIYNYEPQVAREGYGWFNFDPRKDPTRGTTMANVLESL
jgi:fatty acid desaturase